MPLLMTVFLQTDGVMGTRIVRITVMKMLLSAMGQVLYLLVFCRTVSSCSTGLVKNIEAIEKNAKNNTALWE